MRVPASLRACLYLCAAALVALAGEAEAAGRTWDALRVLPHYHSSVESLSAEQRTLLQDVLINATLTWFGRVLKVQRKQSPLAFEQSCSETHRVVRQRRFCVGPCAPSTKCGPFPIPDHHLLPCRFCQGNNCTEARAPGRGVEGADLVVYVSVVSDKDKCRSQLVYGGHCQQEKRLDRPIAAYLSVCPSFLATSQQFYHLQIATLVHHLVRILAFSKSLFPFFRDEGGNPRNERDREGIPLRRHGQYISDGTVRYYGHTPWEAARNVNDTRLLDGPPVHYVKMIITPNVVREVQSHFGCGDVMGGELEGQQLLPSSDADSLWEKRVFGEEVMTASASYHPVLSRLTLALLHDSGWYLPNYSYGASLHWGRGQGCGFIEGSCYKWVWPQKPGTHEEDDNGGGYRDTNVSPFCQRGQDATESCVDQRRAVGVCSIKNYPARLPRLFRYFSTRRRGGASPEADYCPIFKYDFISYQPMGRNCVTAPSTSPHSPEVYGRDSRCFEHSWGSGEGVVGGERGGAGCYTFTCTTDSVVVDVGGSKVNCSRPGEKVEVQFTDNSTTFSGHIVCPLHLDLCENYDCPSLCSGHGSCDKGHCRCQPGYYGNDCSHSYLDRILTCDEVTCRNGGSCVAGGNQFGFSCECVPGFSGSFCENELVPDPCHSLYCSGNTFCTRSGMGTEGSCECLPGYGGENCNNLLLCEQRGRPCDHGRCVLGEASEPRCACDEGYRGPLCDRKEHPNNPCLCLNNGSCSTITDGEKTAYKCTCLPGFKGRRCGQRKNPCRKPNPCHNRGQCHQTMRGNHSLSHLFTCSCPPGFSGELCDFEL